MFGLTISLADYVVMFKGSKRLWWVTRISNNNYRLGPASRRPATKVSVAKVLGNVMADAGTQNGNIIIMNHECCRWNWGLPKKASPYSAARAADVILIVSPVLLKNQDYIKSRQHNSNSHKKNHLDGNRSLNSIDHLVCWGLSLRSTWTIPKWA
jgi:hypothetical protein